MDPWINSLVQSPLVRSLNTVPSRMSSFAHGVRDNVPPFSFVKEVVDPSNSKMGFNPSSLDASAAGVFSYRIPESGLLDRMYLRVRCLNKYADYSAADPTWLPLDPLVAAGATYTNTVRGTVRSTSQKDFTGQSTPMNFAGFIEKISLKTNSSKEIEALYPAIIAAEVQKLPSSQRKFWMMCLNGFAAGPKATYTAANIASNLVTPFTHLWDPFADAFHYKAGDATIRLIENQQNLFVDFLIPLPFSVMHQLKDNFQTRFVENLSVDVTFRSDAGFFRTPATATSGSAGFQASLVCIYHNFHDVIENSIRDQNYKRGFPASVYSHFAIPETNVTVAGKIRSCLLSSQNIISEIHCILKRKDGGTANYLSYSPPPVQGLPGSLAAAPNVAVARGSGQVGPFKFTIKASGRVIWEAYSWELEGPDVADYELADGHAYGEDLSNPVGVELIKQTYGNPLPALGANTDEQLILGSSISLNFRTLYSLRFGFQANDNFYTGGLALQTLSSPTLIVESLGADATPWNTYWEMDVVLRTCGMLRIDSDTGVITKTLDA